MDDDEKEHITLRNSGKSSNGEPLIKIPLSCPQVILDAAECNANENKSEKILKLLPQEGIRKYNESNTKITETKAERMSEYAQYLGLQPAMSMLKLNSSTNIDNSLKKINFVFQESSSLNCSENFFDIEQLEPLNVFNSIPSCKISSINDSETTYDNTSKVQNMIGPKINSTLFKYEIKKTSEKPLKIQCNKLEVNFKNSSTKKIHLTKYTDSKKVYLCAACDTCFENWKLFLHMRDVHRRHLCLFCFGMFEQADRLSYHLIKKHFIPESEFHSEEDFYKIFKNSCYIVCCMCEKIFSDNDSFSEHSCSHQPILLEKMEKKIDACISNSKTSEKCKVLNSFEHSIFDLKPSSTVSAIISSNATFEGARRHSQRILKPNKLLDDIYLCTKLKSYRSKKTNQLNLSEKSDSILNNNENYRKNCFEVKKRSPQYQLCPDLVTETTTEVTNLMNKVEVDKNLISTNDSYQSIPKNVQNYLSIFCCNNMNNKGAQTEFKELILKNDLGKTMFTENSNSNKIITKLLCNSVVDHETLVDNEDNMKINIKSKSKEIIHNNDLDALKNLDLSSELQKSHDLENKILENCSEQEENLTSVFKNETTLSTEQTTGRNLVLKIFTKNRSMFSTNNSLIHSNSNIENYDNFKKSEENNNRDASNEALTPKITSEVNTNYVKMDKLDFAYEDLEDKNNIQYDLLNLVNNKYVPLNCIKDLKEKDIHSMHTVDEKKIDSINKQIENTNEILLAGEEIAIVHLDVENVLENMSVEDILKRCIQAMCSVCDYCNHTRYIAVNGKQLGLHMLAKHRFQPQHPAIIMRCEQLTNKIIENLKFLEPYYFNLDSYNSKDGTFKISTDKAYECFYCRFYCTAFKDLYNHNKKVHQKPILICVMCKFSFYSYSELICHLCPGVPVTSNIKYRCCLCTLSNIPSSFRLMVHLRKQHNACDVCLESTENQQRLSNHIWKHKLNHVCYKCGISYRNKPDITKHLFWKHGTESVLCKRCLQKKWSYIYHFCIPPLNFNCEECGLSFSKAVALKVHKRIHSNNFPYSCLECTEKFVSKKYLEKHCKNHHKLLLSSTRDMLLSFNEIQSSENMLKSQANVDSVNKEVNNVPQLSSVLATNDTFKKVMDVYDLPPLNLSSDSDSEDNQKNIHTRFNDKISSEIKESVNQKSKLLDLSTLPIVHSNCQNNDIVVEVERNEEEKKQEEQIMDGIWDNFKIYTKNLDKCDSYNATLKKDFCSTKDEQDKQIKDLLYFQNLVSADHDYCVVYFNNFQSQVNFNKKLEKNDKISSKQNIESEQGNIHLNKQETTDFNLIKKKVKYKKRNKNSGTSGSEYSTDSESSSCSCKTNCSCSSSSSSTTNSSSCSNSSVSTNSTKKLNCLKKPYKKGTKMITHDWAKIVVKEINVGTENENNEETPKISTQLYTESDFHTTESETDEDFYDEYPLQKTSKLLNQSKNLLVPGIPNSLDVTFSSIKNDVDNVSSALSLNAETLDDYSNLSLFNKTFLRKKHKKSIQNRIGYSARSKNFNKITHPESIDWKKYSSLKNKKKIKKLDFIFNGPLIKIKTDFISDTISAKPSIEESSSMMKLKRLSKRKRVPKRFYGDSGDEENKKQIFKSRKVEFQSSSEVESPNHTNLKFKTQTQHIISREGWKKLKFYEKNETKNKNALVKTLNNKSTELLERNLNWNDSKSKLYSQGKDVSSVSTYEVLHSVEHSKHLYCYCQFPYDEVSEMIACDGHDCQIEWFHFECVGITMPPKGKWYCPECQKKLTLPDNIEDFGA